MEAIAILLFCTSGFLFLSFFELQQLNKTLSEIKTILENKKE